MNLEENQSAQDEKIQPVNIPNNVEREKISGVFSTQNVNRVGTGTTMRKAIQKAYWYAEQIDGEGEPVVQIQPLNDRNVPAGPTEIVPLAMFLEEFSPELEYHQEKVFPQMQAMNETIERAERQREQGAFYSAQFDYEAALDFDETNVRANFGLGLTYMERGETGKADDIFKRVVKLDAAFSPEHKHLFNEFGINLRKSRLLDQAVEYYTRALELTENDEHLHHNIARAYFERGDREECLEHLNKALELNPHLEEAQLFLNYLKKEGA